MNETVLTRSSVNVNTFGKLFARSVDAQIYAQPLYVANLSIGGKTQNVVFVATQGNTVYAFDADSPSATSPLWAKNFGTPVQSSVICSTDTYPQIGITGTPVIDTSSNRMYFVAKTTESNGTYAQRLHVIDITTGSEIVTPVLITATVSGTGTGSSNGQLTFDALHQLNRVSLLLQGGYVYVGFGSHCDTEPYHGWVFAYNTGNLSAAPIVFVDTPNGDEGGIWQGGQGFAGDGSNIYFMTGNGTFDANTGGRSYGDTFLKLTSSLSVSDYFTPSDQATRQQSDYDLGSAGVLLLPSLTGAAGPLAVGGGKLGLLYVVRSSGACGGQVGASCFGGYSSTTDNNYQTVSVGGSFYTSPVFWNNSLYVWAEGQSLKVYPWLSGTGLFQTSPSAASNTTAQFPGGALTISSNGTSNGIVWATTPSGSNNANHQTVPGVLHAYDATNVSTELWNSYQNQTRDDFGNLAKFCPPVVANGKVYIATFSNLLAVYGNLSTNTQAPTAPGNLTASAASNASITLKWSASTASGGATIAAYYIYRTYQGTTSTAGQVNGSTLSFTDTGLKSNTAYQYTAKALDSNNNFSPSSNTAKAKTPK